MFMAGNTFFPKAPHLVEPGVSIGEALEVLGAHSRFPWEVARLRGRGRIVDAAALRVGRQYHCTTQGFNARYQPSNMLPGWIATVNSGMGSIHHPSYFGHWVLRK